jgi:CBS domain-containing protein
MVVLALPRGGVPVAFEVARDLGAPLDVFVVRKLVIGILTSRDMLRAFAGRVHSSEARAREWMTAEPIAVSPTTPLEAAALLMSEHHIHHLPVVEGERPVAMVGMRDVVRACRFGRESASPLSSDSRDSPASTVRELTSAAAGWAILAVGSV